MGKAADLVTATLEILQQFRSDEEWDKMYQYICNATALYNITISPLRSQRPQRWTPGRFNEGFVMETTGNRAIPTSSDEYKVTLYFPVLDSMIAEFQKRFGSKNVQLMKAIRCCHPESPNFLEVEHLMSLVTAYHLDRESLAIECSIAQKFLRDKELEGVNEVLLEILPLRDTFPVLLKLIQISLTITVSTAKCERSFSSLK